MRIDIALDLFYLPMNIATVRLGLLLQKLNVFFYDPPDLIDIR